MVPDPSSLDQILGMIKMAAISVLLLAFPPCAGGDVLGSELDREQLHTFFGRRDPSASTPSLAFLQESRTAGSGSTCRSAYRRRRISRCDVSLRLPCRDRSGKGKGACPALQDLLPDRSQLLLSRPRQDV